jgi:cbb3-type cytochrome oxidase subunit 3
MGLLILEALLALGVLLFIVWWTMFSGRRRGERDPQDLARKDDARGGSSGSGRRPQK